MAVSSSLADGEVEGVDGLPAHLGHLDGDGLVLVDRGRRLHELGDVERHGEDHHGQHVHRHALRRAHRHVQVSVRIETFMKVGWCNWTQRVSLVSLWSPSICFTLFIAQFSAIHYTDAPRLIVMQLFKEGLKFQSLQSNEILLYVTVTLGTRNPIVSKFTVKIHASDNFQCKEM